MSTPYGSKLKFVLKPFLFKMNLNILGHGVAIKFKKKACFKYYNKISY
jgi:hypothetical protein